MNLLTKICGTSVEAVQKAAILQKKYENL